MSVWTGMMFENVAKNQNGKKDGIIMDGFDDGLIKENDYIRTSATD